MLTHRHRFIGTILNAVTNLTFLMMKVGKTLPTLRESLNYNPVQYKVNIRFGGS